MPKYKILRLMEQFQVRRLPVGLLLGAELDPPRHRLEDPAHEEEHGQHDAQAVVPQEPIHAASSFLGSRHPGPTCEGRSASGVPDDMRHRWHRHEALPEGWHRDCVRQD